MATCPKCYGFLDEGHRCPKPRWMRTLSRLLTGLSTERGDERPAPPRGTGRIVLVVDDEPSVRALLVRWLGGWGYRTWQAETADEALAIMSATPIAILLSDIQMPGRDGLWLVGHVRARWPNVAIIMASGVDDFDRIRRSRSLGAMAYVTKPFDPALLHQALERATANMLGKLQID